MGSASMSLLCVCLLLLAIPATLCQEIDHIHSFALMDSNDQCCQNFEELKELMTRMMMNKRLFIQKKRGSRRMSIEPEGIMKPVRFGSRLYVTRMTNNLVREILMP